MIALVFIIAVIVARAFIVIPDRAPEALPECLTCGAKFLDARGVDWHRAACHPHVEPLTHDEGSIAKWNR